MPCPFNNVINIYLKSSFYFSTSPNFSIMKSDFIPAALGDLDTWEVNFKNKVPNIAQQLGINQTEVTAVLDLLDAHRGFYATMVAKRNEAKAATSNNNAGETAAVKSIRDLCNRIKADKSYTEAIGNELKIIGSLSTFDKAIAKPTLAATKEGSGIVIKFVKDKTSGIHIYSRRNGETDFSFLAVDTASPYHDNRPKLGSNTTENREYKAWYFIDENIIGLESDVISVVL